MKRDDFIDAVKGIGILFVILGHTFGIPEIIYNIMYSFHMPLFFIIAGYLYDENKYNSCNLKKVALKKAKSYLVPYYSFAGINLILTIVWNVTIKQIPVTIANIKLYIAGILYCYADMEHMPNCSPIWFLMCLFISSLIFWAIIKYCTKTVMLISVGLMLLSYGLSFLTIRLPLNISTACMGVFFMYIGLCIKKYDVLKRRCFVVLAIFGMIAAIINGGQVGMNENTYGNLFLFLVSAIILSLFVMYVCKKVNIIKNNFFIWLGKNTLPIIGLNYFLRDFTTELYYLIPYVRNYHLHWSVSFIMTVVVCLFVIWSINKIKYHYSIAKAIN